MFVLWQMWIRDHINFPRCNNRASRVFFRPVNRGNNHWGIYISPKVLHVGLCSQSHTHQSFTWNRTKRLTWPGIGPWTFAAQHTHITNYANNHVTQRRRLFYNHIKSRLTRIFIKFYQLMPMGQLWLSYIIHCWRDRNQKSWWRTKLGVKDHFVLLD